MKSTCKLTASEYSASHPPFLITPPRFSSLLKMWSRSRWKNSWYIFICMYLFINCKWVWVLYPATFTCQQFSIKRLCLQKGGKQWEKVLRKIVSSVLDYVLKIPGIQFKRASQQIASFAGTDESLVFCEAEMDK